MNPNNHFPILHNTATHNLKSSCFMQPRYMSLTGAQSDCIGSVKQLSVPCAVSIAVTSSLDTPPQSMVPFFFPIQQLMSHLKASYLAHHVCGQPCRDRSCPWSTLTGHSTFSPWPPLDASSSLSHSSLILNSPLLHPGLWQPTLWWTIYNSYFESETEVHVLGKASSDSSWFHPTYHFLLSGCLILFFSGACHNI